MKSVLIPARAGTWQPGVVQEGQGHSNQGSCGLMGPGDTGGPVLLGTEDWGSVGSRQGYRAMQGGGGAEIVPGLQCWAQQMSSRDPGTGTQAQPGPLGKP